MKNETEGNRSQWALDHTLSLAATVIALCALGLSLYEGYTARKQVRLQSQPFFQYTYFYGESGAGWKLHNSGLGPARLRAFRMQVDGKPITDFKNLASILGLRGAPGFRFTNPRVGDRYAAGHENILFWVDSVDFAAALRTNWTRVNLEACYCSLYNECWLFSTDGRFQAARGEHMRDDNCSPFAGSTLDRWWGG